MLKVISISKTFSPDTPREFQVLSDVTFEVPSGQFAVLLGSNGTGKSTLLRIIAGDVTADEGEVWTGNVNVSRLESFQRARHLSFVRQSRESNLASHLTVAQNVMLALTARQRFLSIVTGRRFKGAIETLLGSAKPNLIRHAGEQVWSLSGGEHQTLAVLVAGEIARLNGRSGILLLDEHVAHLDSSSATRVMDFTTQLVRQYGLTVLMVTHNIHIACNYGDRILVLKDKRVAFDKTFASGEVRDQNEIAKLIS